MLILAGNRTGADDPTLHEAKWYNQITQQTPVDVPNYKCNPRTGQAPCNDPDTCVNYGLGCFGGPDCKSYLRTFQTPWGLCDTYSPGTGSSCPLKPRTVCEVATAFFNLDCDDQKCNVYLYISDACAIQ